MVMKVTKNLSKGENQKPVDYRKKYYRIGKKHLIVKSNGSRNFFEAYLNKNFWSIYKNRKKNI